MASAFTSLAAPALEDSMEVSSSPAAGDLFDTDIDIDYDDYSGGVHLADDDRMLEDGDPTRPPTATDEMMDDEEHTTTLVEEVMHDDIPHDEAAQPEPADEELIDYDDDLDVDQSFFDDTTLQNTETVFAAPTEVAQEPAISHEEVVERPELATDELASLQEPGVPTGDNEEAATLEAPTHAEEVLEPQTELNVETEHSTSAAQSDKSAVAGEASLAVSGTAVDGSDQFHAEGESTTQQPEHSEDATASLKAPPHLPGALDTTALDIPDGPPTPTDTGLHPTTVNYRAYSMPMFKSSRQPDGLLKNDNLASIGLSNLMQDCRARLKVKLGEEITEDDDIVLVFDRLGLMLVEGNTSTFDTSLNDIIEVWQQLHSNDGVQDAPPLTVTLTSQPKFSTSVSKLQKAVNDGQGISSIPQSYTADEDPYEDDGEAELAEEYPIEEGQDFTGEEHGEEHYEEYEDSYAHEHPERQQEYQEDAGTELEASHEAIDQADEEHQAHVEPAEAAEAAENHQDEVNYEDFNELEEYPDPEDFDRHEEVEKTFEASEDQAQELAGEEKPAEDVKPDSAASSTTVRGDAVNDTTGEYDADDYIDWSDDENLTGSSSEAHADEGEDVFSTLLTEYDADAGEPGAEHAQKSDESGPSPKATAPGNEPSELHPSGVDAEEQVAFGLDTEDLLSYDDDDDQQAQGDVAAAGTNDVPAQVNPNDDGLIEYDDETFDEADNVDHDNQDDEQFHTALDLLDGDDTEHGLEEPNTAETHERQEKIVDEDDIGYDDDDYGQPKTTANGGANSPLGKRSFDEHAEEDELNFDDEPELKKARSD